VNDRGPYPVQYDPRAAKELTKPDRTIARRIVVAVNDLAEQPRPQSARQLAGYPCLCCVRVGDYRVVYTIKDAELVVLALRIAIEAASTETSELMLGRLGRSSLL
jgi:mRNA interferase RelE/StbE